MSECVLGFYNEFLQRGRLSRASKLMQPYDAPLELACVPNACSSDPGAPEEVNCLYASSPQLETSLSDG